MNRAFRSNARRFRGAVAAGALCCCISSTLRAQNLTLGAELDLDPVALVPSGLARSRPTAGMMRQSGMSLVVWADHRPGDPRLGSGIYSSIPQPEFGLLATRVSAQGEKLDPTGFILARYLPQAVTPAVAGDWRRVLVVWESEGTLRFTSADDTGQVDKEGPYGLTTTGESHHPALACGAASCLVAWEEGSPDSVRVAAGLLDGSELLPIEVPAPPPGSVALDPVLVMPVKANWGTTQLASLLLWRETGAAGQGVRAIRISPQATALDTSPLRLCEAAVSPQSLTAAQAEERGFLVAWSELGAEGNDVRGMRLDLEGALLESPQVLAGGPGEQVHPRVAGNAAGFHLTWEDYAFEGSALRYVPVGLDGTVGTAQPLPAITTSWPRAARPELTSTWEYGVVTTWREAEGELGDVYAALFRAEAGTEPSRMLLSGIGQEEQLESMTAGEGEYVVVSRSAASTISLATRVSMHGMARGTPIELPRGAGIHHAGGTRYLVLWVEASGSTAYQPRAAWLDLAQPGELLDSLALGEPSASSGRPIAARDGGRFLVLTGAGRAFWVDAGGATGLELELPVPPYGVAHGVGGFLVTGSRSRLDLKTQSEVVAARLSNQAELMDAEGFSLVQGYSYQSRPSVAWNGEEYLVVFQAGDAEHNGTLTAPIAVRVTERGEVLDPAGIEVAPEVPMGEYQYPVVAWDGTSFVVGWSSWWRGHYEVRVPYAARVSPAGEALDPAGVRFEYPIALEPQQAAAPLVATLGAGESLFAFRREDFSAGGAFRIKLRTLSDPRANGKECYFEDDCSSGHCEAGQCRRAPSGPAGGAGGRGGVGGGDARNVTGGGLEDGLGGTAGSLSGAAGETCSAEGGVCDCAPHGRGCSCGLVGRSSRFEIWALVILLGWVTSRRRQRRSVLGLSALVWGGCGRTVEDCPCGPASDECGAAGSSAAAGAGAVGGTEQTGGEGGAAGATVAEAGTAALAGSAGCPPGACGAAGAPSVVPSRAALRGVYDVGFGPGPSPATSSCSLDWSGKSHRLALFTGRCAKAGCVTSAFGVPAIHSSGWSPASETLTADSVVLEGFQGENEDIERLVLELVDGKLSGLGIATIRRSCRGTEVESFDVALTVTPDRTPAHVFPDPPDSIAPYAVSWGSFHVGATEPIDFGDVGTRFSDLFALRDVGDPTHHPALTGDLSMWVGFDVVHPEEVAGGTYTLVLRAPLKDSVGNPAVADDQPITFVDDAVLAGTLDFDLTAGKGYVGRAEYFAPGTPGAPCESGGCLVLGPVSPCTTSPGTLLSLRFAADQRMAVRVRCAWQTDRAETPAYPMWIDDVDYIQGWIGNPPALTPLATPIDGLTHGSPFIDAEFVTQSPVPRGGALGFGCDDAGSLDDARVRLVIERIEVAPHPDATD